MTAKIDLTNRQISINNKLELLPNDHFCLLDHLGSKNLKSYFLPNLARIKTKTAIARREAT